METIENEIEKEIQKRKGLVISFDPEVYKYNPMHGDDTDDSRINVKDGLPYDLINGIKAIGPEATQYFNNLKK